MRQRSIGLLGIALMLIVLTGFVKKDSWYSLKSAEFSYSIQFPQKPTENPQVVESEVGQLKLNIFMHDASEDQSDENLMYMVNCTEYPFAIMDTEDSSLLDDFYRSSIDGAVSNVNGKLLTEEIIKLDDHVGREVTVDFQDGMAIIQMRIFLVGNRLYLLQSFTETPKHPNKSVAKFMDSFELL